MIEKYFSPFSARVSAWAGSYVAFVAAIMLVFGWAAFGPVTGYSNDWMLVINTSTTVITFLMVFIIQSSQNRERAPCRSRSTNSSVRRVERATP
jgi:low affinity Fe/Cu permease